MDRDMTAENLERAAVDLLERDGILSGLNLREVADHAEVNRGLVYHYFGSKRDLLRTAMRRIVKRSVGNRVVDETPVRIADEMSHRLQVGVDHAEVYRLLALLVLDRDERLDLAPDAADTHSAFTRYQRDGMIAENVDLVALQAVMHALPLGYSLERELLAKQFGIAVGELDARVEALVTDITARVDGPNVERRSA